MSDHSTADIYESFFNPRSYLEQFYATPDLASDDVGLFRHMAHRLQSLDRQFECAIDIGCGPTIHGSFAIAPWASKIDLSDYLPENLAEINRWIVEDASAHDWDKHLSGVLGCEGVSASMLETRKALYRAKVRRLRHCDLRAGQILDNHDRFDLVTTFHCVECVASSREEWRTMAGRIVDLVAPNGLLVIAGMRSATRYNVLGHWFPVVPLTERDVLDLLVERGFMKERITTSIIDVAEWSHDGFSQTYVVSAIRPGTGD